MRAARRSRQTRREKADAADIYYAAIRAALEKKETPIGAHDMLIAAHARAIDAVCVTDNVTEFNRVPGLKVENWLA